MSVDFTCYEVTTGRVQFSGTTDSLDLLKQENRVVLEGVVYVGGWIENGIHFELPEQNSMHHVFNYNTKEWVDPRTLQDHKTAKWLEIKQARSQAEYAGFTWDGSVFDSDAISQQRITGAVTLAQMDAAFSIGWTLADNTVRQLSAAEMKDVGTALGVHVATQFARAQDLRTQLDAAQTAEEVAAVSW
jgi:hypothetical protein